MPMDNICCDVINDVDSSDGTVTVTVPTEEGILECDYDSQCTKLYKLIEEKKWEEVLNYLETGKFYDTSILSSIFGKDPEDPSVATRTWVTSLDGKGKVRWCQLPLHAAVTFRAPFKVIESLVRVYPRSVRCADDQDMLPLHYAFRFGAEDDVLIYLLDKFPQAVGKEAVKGRLPLDMAQYGPKADRGMLIEFYVENAIQGAKEEWDREYEKIVTGMNTESESTLVNELTSKRQELIETQRELALARKDIERLKEEMAGLSGEDADIKYTRSLRSSRMTSQSDPVSLFATKKYRISNIETSSSNGKDRTLKQTNSSKDPRLSRGSRKNDESVTTATEDGIGKFKGFGQFFGRRKK